MSKHYGGTITVLGRDLITSLMAGETIEFTKVVVGAGELPEGVEPIDVTELYKPIALASSTIPTVENSVLSMVVEYRNDMNGGLTTGFWLREFGIYAKTANTEEVLLYYATLGDSPQPVSAFKDNRIDIRRYPVTIALELDCDIEVTYNPGAFITAEEAHELISAMVQKAFAPIVSITIPAEGWTQAESGEQSAAGTEFPLVLDLTCEEAKESYVPCVTLDIPSLNIANVAGLCPTIQAFDGTLRFWAKEHPMAAMNALVAFIPCGAPAAEGDITIADYVLPAATSTTLGGVRVQEGSGLSVDDEGYLTIDAATEDETEEMYENTTGIPSDGVDISDVNIATDQEVLDVYESAQPVD